VTPFPYASGQYHVTLQAVGESDGKSTYQVFVNESKLGDFTCPLSTETYEEGPQFQTTWQAVKINQGAAIAVRSQIASEDGQEHSRARIARLVFEPADAAIREAAAFLASLAKPAAQKQAATATAPAKPSAPLVLPRRPDGKGNVTITGELKQWHKVILSLDETVSSANAEAFTVSVTRHTDCVDLPPEQASGERVVIHAYVSDVRGRKRDEGTHVTLVLGVAPQWPLSSPLQYVRGETCRGTRWVDYRLTIKDEASGRVWNTVLTRWPSIKNC